MERSALVVVESQENLALVGLPAKRPGHTDSRFGL